MKALQELVDRCADETGDWDDVLHRAGVRRGATRRRGLVIGIAVAAAVLAAPAFALLFDWIGRKDVVFENTRPAPNIVKLQFSELAIGAPRGMDPQVIAEETRKLTVELGARTRVLYVAPTKRGGFCYHLEGGSGGCVRDGGFTPAINLTTGGRMRRGEPFELVHVGGTLQDARTAKIRLGFRTGDPVDIPFVWVSEPIDAGFFVYDVPPDRRREAVGPVLLVAQDANGAEIARETRGFHYPDPMKRPGVLSSGQESQPQRLRERPPVAPSAPVQTVERNGVVVTAGRNGAVEFDLSGIDAERGRLLRAGRTAGFTCWRIVTSFGFTFPRGYGISGRFGERIGARFTGVPTPFDACEIQGSYGHRWPDRFGGHAIVELPFNEKARRYFEDRAAARDLALFVRMREMQQTRKRPPDELRAALARRDTGQIRYEIDANGVTFSRVSTTGRRFFVRVENGKIVRENLGRLAMVF